jgi:hypothetical protein
MRKGKMLLGLGMAVLMGMFCISCESDDDNGGGSSGVPWDQVTWVNGNGSVANWAETVKISSANVAGGIVSWTYETPPSGWPSTGRIHGNPDANVGWVAQIDGQWYGAMGEWLKPGGTWQQTIMFESDRGNTRLFGEPLQYYRPSSGQEFYIFVSGLNFGGLSNVQERSNLVKVTIP